MSYRVAALKWWAVSFCFWQITSFPPSRSGFWRLESRECIKRVFRHRCDLFAYLCRTFWSYNKNFSEKDLFCDVWLVSSSFIPPAEVNYLLLSKAWYLNYINYLLKWRTILNRLVYRLSSRIYAGSFLVTKPQTRKNFHNLYWLTELEQITAYLSFRYSDTECHQNLFIFENVTIKQIKVTFVLIIPIC